jgi:glutathione S-transferase
MVLNTFALSHYCETARWALDYKGVQYVERSWAPLLHMFRTWRLKQTYTPILRVDGVAMQESTDICAFLESRFPAPALIPEARREEVMQIAEEARAIGVHVRRLAYSGLGQDLGLLRDGWALNVGAWEQRLSRLLFPITRRLVFKRFRVNEAGVEESEEAVRAFLDDREGSFGDGREFLVGDQFTLADLTTAAMLSPLVRPQEHPFYSRLPLGDGMARLVDSFRGYPMLDWVRHAYRSHRVITE